MNIDRIIYNAICADADLMEAIGDRVKSTCFEVSPDEKDNTQTPYIIVTDDGFRMQPGSKDCVWEGTEDQWQATAIVSANSPIEVQQLIKSVRRAVENYVVTLYQAGGKTPTLESLQASQLAWDWTKPCYYQELTYTVTQPAENEQEN